MTTPTTPMPTPTDFPCPRCGSPIGEPCQMETGRTGPHARRVHRQITAAIKWAVRNNTEERQ